MDPSLQSRSPNNSDVKASFRKPTNDAANRKYRRRSPVSGSASSSSSGSPKHERGYSPMLYKENASTVFDGRRITKNESDDRWKMREERDLNKDLAHNHSGKLSDSYRHSERQSHSNSHDYRRHNDYGRHNRHTVDEERNQRYSSRSGWDSRERYDYPRHDNDRDRSKDNWRGSDKYSRDRSDDGRPRYKDSERDAGAQEHRRHKDKDLSFEKVNLGERDRNRDREGGRDDRRDHRRSLGDYKNGKASAYEECRGRESGVNYLNDGHKGSSRELDGCKEDEIQRRKNEEREQERHKDRYGREHEECAQHDCRSSSTYRERDEKNVQYHDKPIHLDVDKDSPAKKHKLCQSDKAAGNAKDEHPPNSATIASDVKSPTTSKQVQEPVGKGVLGPFHSAASESEMVHDLNAAKVAAMKAAELVNKNLVGSGYLSTDQKKKLLWGNKKNDTPEDSGNRWDTTLFPDRDRQEKFNKLMGVKGDPRLEQKSDSKDGSDLLRAEKQKELQLDLEKQYTAGLRRRDGRTVGLGL